MANEDRVKTVANIQGLAGPYMRYADGRLSLWDKWMNITPLDFYRGTFLLNAKRSSSIVLNASIMYSHILLIL